MKSSRRAQKTMMNSNNPTLIPLPPDDDSPPPPPQERTEQLVTPPPTVLFESARSEKKTSVLSSEIENLFDLLGVSRHDDEFPALCDLFTRLGVKSVNDLAFLQEKDIKDSLVSPVIQRKLLLVATHVLQAGSLENVESIRELQVSRKQQSVSESTATKRHLAETESMDENIIRLDVGGFKFTTTRATLCRVKGSLLEGMFSGRHSKPAPRDAAGFYIIDRNGTHFEHILDFLRVGAVISLPFDSLSKEALAIEADYYGLDELVRALRMPQVDASEHLSEEVLSIRREESVLRKGFMDGSSEVLDPHRGLIPLFCPDNGVRPLPVKYNPMMENERDLVMENLRKQASPGTRVTTTSLNEFESNFNKEFPNVLHRLSDVLRSEPIIIAGGSVLRALTSSKRIRTAAWWGKKSDIDIFLYCQEPREANRIAKRIFFSIAADHERWAIVRGRGVITMNNWTSGQWTSNVDLKIQIVLRLYDSPAEVLFGFDCDCCCCAYDGRQVWVTPRCLLALQTGVNILNPIHAWPNKSSYELRLAKYAHRGFPVVVPGLNRKRINYEQIRRTPLGDLKGLARLLKVSFETEADNGADTNLRVPYHEPEYIPRLRAETIRCFSETEMLTRGLLGGYDDVDDGVIIPTVYGADGEPTALMWFAYVGGQPDDFPLARDCREEAWNDIRSAPSEVEGVPTRLLDAWDREKRSREYLNSEMDKFDLDNIYYGHAYCEDVS